MNKLRQNTWRNKIKFKNKNSKAWIVRKKKQTKRDQIIEIKGTMQWVETQVSES